MSPAGLIKPIKKPKPKKIALAGGNFAWLDAEENLEEGISIYTCIQEDPAIFDELNGFVFDIDEEVYLAELEAEIKRQDEER